MFHFVVIWRSLQDCKQGQSLSARNQQLLCQGIAMWIFFNTIIFFNIFTERQLKYE